MDMEIEEDGLSLPGDAWFEVIRRTDALALANVASVSKSFQTLVAHERLWENLCNSRWPSTLCPNSRSIIISSGGFRKFFSQSYPVIVNTRPLVDKFGSLAILDAEWEFDDDGEEDDYLGKSCDFSAPHLVSFVDVIFRGKPVLSRVIEGVPGADSLYGWFSSCPFRIGLLKPAEEYVSNGEEYPTFCIGLENEVGVEDERKQDKVWKSLWDNVRVSWILMNKKSGQMVNLSSWIPIGGKHWPTDEDFVLHFGSIVPSCKSDVKASKPCVVHCNIVLKCHLIEEMSGTDSKKSLELKELSIQLEDMNGAHLNGHDSLSVLQNALTCWRSKNYEECLDSYCRYEEAKSLLRETNSRQERLLDAFVFALAFVAVMVGRYLLF